ncbi:MAG: D-alanyl-D-alanine carboxypeptidase family protein [Pseudomonadota bacterium]
MSTHKTLPKSYNMYWSALYFICIFIFCINPVEAKKNKAPTQSPASRCTTASVTGEILPCRKSTPTSLVVDAKTGRVLHSEEAHTSIYPASLTKIMTLYLAFEAVENGKLSMGQKIAVSAKAANMPPLKLWLKPGETITVRDAIMTLIVHSANDSAVVISEALGQGSEAKFADLMTKRARQLGMSNTQFRNASGWYHPDQKTTAHDLAKLAIAIKRDFPQYYPLFTQTQVVFRGKTIHGHNRVTANYPGAEGLKTGFNNPAGVCIVTTASRDNQELVGIVTGSPSARHRDSKVMTLLDKHFKSPRPVTAKCEKIKKAAAIKVVAHNKLLKKKYSKAPSQRKQKSV